MTTNRQSQSSSSTLRHHRLRDRENRNAHKGGEQLFTRGAPRLNGRPQRYTTQTGRRNQICTKDFGCPIDRMLPHQHHDNSSNHSTSQRPNPTSHNTFPTTPTSKHSRHRTAHSHVLRGGTNQCQQASTSLHHCPTITSNMDANTKTTGKRDYN